MSKRKREIEKRKRLAEEVQEDESLLKAESVENVGIAQDPEFDEPEDLQPPESPVEDNQIVSTPAPRTAKKSASMKEKQGRKSAATVTTDSWLGQNKENFLLGLLILYVLLLGLGTVGELFEVEWILNLPLFR